MGQGQRDKEGLLGDLDALRRLLAAERQAAPAVDPDAIPLLQEVVEASALPAEPKGGGRPPSAREIEALVDALLDRKLARVREELRRELMTQLRRLLPALGAGN